MSDAFRVPAIDGAASGDGKSSDTVPEFLPEFVNCKPEDDPIICRLAEREQVALLAFIAPQVPVRISPVQEARATIGLLDEFGVEALVNKLHEAKVEKAYLLVNSPGGAMHSSYKIAIAIRTALKDVTTFVPHVAASGGTLLTLVGNRIVLGPMSHITPLDTQVPYKDERISATSGTRFFQRATEWFAKITPEEAPYPQRALTEKLDPILMEEWNGLIDAMIDYVYEVLVASGYEKPKAFTTARSLVAEHPTHSYVLNHVKAKQLGLNVTHSSEEASTWEVMRYWLGKYLVEQEATHCIRFVIPGKQTAEIVAPEEALSTTGREGED